MTVVNWRFVHMCELLWRRVSESGLQATVSFGRRQQRINPLCKPVFVAGSKQQVLHNVVLCAVACHALTGLLVCPPGFALAAIPTAGGVEPNAAFTPFTSLSPRPEARIPKPVEMRHRCRIEKLIFAMYCGILYVNGLNGNGGYRLTYNTIICKGECMGDYRGVISELMAIECSYIEGRFTLSEYMWECAGWLNRRQALTTILADKDRDFLLAVAERKMKSEILRN